MSIGSNTEIDDDVRVQALSMIIFAILKQKTLLSKLGLIPVLVSGMFPIAAEQQDEDDSLEIETPMKLSLQVLSTISLSCPPSVVFSEVSKMVGNYCISPIDGNRKAAMLAISTLSAGCADFMRQYVDKILELIVSGMQDSVSVVRKAACLALGSLCDDLYEELNVHNAILLPILFNLINDSDIKVMEHSLSALDVLLESMGATIIPYLPVLIEKLGYLMDHAPLSLRLRGMNCIGSAAHAAEQEFTPYFEHIFPRLRHLMTLTESSDYELRSAATDAMGPVAKAVGKDIFRPFLSETVELAMQGVLMKNANLQMCGHYFFATTSKVFGQEFAPYLNVLVKLLFETLAQEEKEQMFFGGNGDDGEEDIEEDIEDMDSTSGENVQIMSEITHEKEVAISTLGDFFEATEQSFLPYVSQSLNFGLELLDHYHEQVRQAAVEFLCRFLRVIYKIGQGSENWTPGLPLKVELHENVKNMTKVVMDGILLMLSQEEDRYLNLN
jgi:hypothetical protein